MLVNVCHPPSINAQILKKAKILYHNHQNDRTTDNKISIAKRFYKKKHSAINIVASSLTLSTTTTAYKSYSKNNNNFSIAKTYPAVWHIYLQSVKYNIRLKHYKKVKGTVNKLQIFTHSAVQLLAFWAIK